jgi:hypothetical protein
MSQPPANKDATEHSPLVSDTLKEHADENQLAAERSKQQTQRIQQTEERLHRRQDTEGSRP